jgi:hypothetical protein
VTLAITRGSGVVWSANFAFKLINDSTEMLVMSKLQKMGFQSEI